MKCSVSENPCGSELAREGDLTDTFSQRLSASCLCFGSNLSSLLMKGAKECQNYQPRIACALAVTTNLTAYIY